VASHRKILTEKCNASFSGCFMIALYASARDLGSYSKLRMLSYNTCEKTWEERGFKQGILYIKSLIINIKAASGTEQPCTMKTLFPI